MHGPARMSSKVTRALQGTAAPLRACPTLTGWLLTEECPELPSPRPTIHPLRSPLTHPSDTQFSLDNSSMQGPGRVLRSQMRPTPSLPGTVGQHRDSTAQSRAGMALSGGVREGFLGKGCFRRALTGWRDFVKWNRRARTLLAVWTVGPIHLSSPSTHTPMKSGDAVLGTRGEEGTLPGGT